MFFDTKLISCGNFNCRHNYRDDGTCNLKKICLDKNGKCILFTSTPRPPIKRPADEIDEHTNMC